MQELFEKLNDESRRAMFSALAAAVASGHTHVGTSTVAANLIRTDKVAAALTRERIDSESILSDLNESVPHASTLEARLEHAAAHLHPAGTFAILPMSEDLIASLNPLLFEPAGSIGPVRVLLSIVAIDTVVRSVFESHGCSGATLERYA
jgi:hypothetical protein